MQSSTDSVVADSAATKTVVKANTEIKSGTLWTAINPASFKGMDTVAVRFKRYKLFALDSMLMQSLLQKSPAEKQRKSSPDNIIDLPKPDGGYMQFSIYSTSVMDSALEAKYPSLKTYGGQGINDRTAMLRMDFNQNGFHAYVISQAGEWIIQPSARGITHQSLVCFFKQDAIIPNRVPFELPDSMRNRRK